MTEPVGETETVTAMETAPGPKVETKAGTPGKAVDL